MESAAVVCCRNITEAAGLDSRHIAKQLGFQTISVYGRTLAKLLAEKSPDTPIPAKCNVTSVFYTGDMGGIICGLDIGGPETETPHLVSISHPTFHRRVPLSREIKAYQRHRTKKLRQQQNRGY
jgi:hypothetical protein